MSEKADIRKSWSRNESGKSMRNVAGLRFKVVKKKDDIPIQQLMIIVSGKIRQERHMLDVIKLW